jgi:hypothetical protein
MPGTIKRDSAKRNRHKKKANYLKNKARRSDLYAEHAGSSGWQRNVREWHETLYALSHGTAS